MDLISVIVPIYKVEKYLDKCVESIVNQTYKNLEIILVDDGSPDSCPQMCDQWAQKDQRIKVIHKQNGGLSDARNAGMKIATGEYVAFIDSDDYIACEFVEKLYDTMTKEQSDIVECAVIKFNEGEVPAIPNIDSELESFDTNMGLSLLMAEKGFHQYVWNKLYKAELALTVDFAKGKLNEDEFWTYQVFGKAKKVTSINLPMYFYLQRSSSIMGTSYNIHRLDALEAKVQRQEYIKKYFPNLVIQAKINLFASCVYAYQCILKFMTGKDKKKALAIVKEYAKENKLAKEDLAVLSGKSRKWFWFANKNLYLCCKIRNILDVGF